MAPKNRYRLVVILILAVPLAIFIGAVIYNGLSLPPLPALPNPNGYDDLRKSTTMLASNISDNASLNQADLQTLVSRDSNALALARAGLQEPCRVPLDYSPTSTAAMDRLAGIKRLSLAFAAEGRLAEMQGHSNEAVKSYLDLIHLGNESSRGGVLIDELVGIAIEAMGANDLKKLLPTLDAKTCRETAAKLETLDAQRQTWDDVMQQEQDWSRRTFPGIQADIERFAQRKFLRQIDQKAEQKFEKQEIETRQLVIAFAARAYELDNGRPPASVADLAPEYLKAIPQDPNTGTNMVY